MTNFDGEKPIYIQMAEWIEENILTGVFPEETQIPSTTEISAIYKKRGLGMFVCTGAEQKIRSERKQEFCDKYIKSLISEASKLGITKNEIINMIEKGCDGNEQN